MALGSYPCWSYHRPPPCTPCSSSLGAVAWPQAKLRTLDTLDPSDSLPSTLVTFVTTASFLALPPHCARSRRSSKTTGATTRSRSLAFPVTAYGASHRGAGPSSSPFAVTFTLKMPVALPYHITAHHLCAPCSSSFGAVAWPRILPCPSPPLRTEQAILEDHRRDDSFAKPRFSCYGIWCFTSRRRTIIVSFRGDVHPQNAGRTALSYHRPPPLRALLILFWRGCLAAGQASYTRHLVSPFLALPPHCARSRRSLKTTGDSRPTSAGTGAAAPWDFAGKWLAGEQRRAVQRFARLCSSRHRMTPVCVGNSS